VSDDPLVQEIHGLEAAARDLRQQRDKLAARLHYDCPGCPGCDSGDCPDALDVARGDANELRAALETLLTRIDEMPNPHADPMRHYYNQMATWKGDARAAIAKAGGAP
jgi:hypothetical protein